METCQSVVLYFYQRYSLKVYVEFFAARPTFLNLRTNIYNSVTKRMSPTQYRYNTTIPSSLVTLITVNLSCFVSFQLNIFRHWWLVQTTIPVKNTPLGPGGGLGVWGWGGGGAGGGGRGGGGGPPPPPKRLLLRKAEGMQSRTFEYMYTSGDSDYKKVVHRFPNFKFLVFWRIFLYRSMLGWVPTNSIIKLLSKCYAAQRLSNFKC